MAHAGGGAAREQAARRAGVVAVVLQRIAHRLGHDRVRGEMHDGVDRVLAEHALDQRAIADVADDELARRAYRFAKSGAEIVEHDDRLAALAQLQRDVAADVAGAAGDEDGAHRTRNFLKAERYPVRGPQARRAGAEAAHVSACR